jgi:hypothetical protein
MSLARNPLASTAPPLAISTSAPGGTVSRSARSKEPRTWLVSLAVMRTPSAVCAAAMAPSSASRKPDLRTVPRTWTTGRLPVCIVTGTSLTSTMTCGARPPAPKLLSRLDVTARALAFRKTNPKCVWVPGADPDA